MHIQNIKIHFYSLLNFVCTTCILSFNIFFWEGYFISYVKWQRLPKIKIYFAFISLVPLDLSLFVVQLSLALKNHLIPVPNYLNLNFNTVACMQNSNLDSLMPLVVHHNNIILLCLPPLWFLYRHIQSILDLVQVSVPPTNNVHNAFQIHNVQQLPIVYRNDFVISQYDKDLYFLQLTLDFPPLISTIPISLVSYPNVH